MPEPVQQVISDLLKAEIAAAQKTPSPLARRLTCEASSIGTALLILNFHQMSVCYPQLAKSEIMSAINLIRLFHLTAIQRDLDKLANNVANVSTAGFKGQRASFKEVVKQAEQSFENPSKDKYYSIVGYSTVTTNFSQGEIEYTGNPTDVAIKGDGWFVV